MSEEIRLKHGLQEGDYEISVRKKTPSSSQTTGCLLVILAGLALLGALAGTALAVF